MRLILNRPAVSVWEGFFGFGFVVSTDVPRTECDFLNRNKEHFWARANSGVRKKGTVDTAANRGSL